MLGDVPEDYLKEVRAAWNLLAPPNDPERRDDYRVTDSSVSVLDEPVQYGLDASGMRHILVPCGNRRIARHDHTCDGVWIDATQASSGGRTVWLLDVSYQWRSNPELFSLFGSSLMWELAVCPSDPVQVVFGALARWKALFSHGHSGTLDKSTALGLFGELWHLAILSEIRADAVTYWTGPEGQQHDFQFPSGALEVKTTTARNNHLVWINGLDQLAADRPLALALLEVDAGAGESTSLSELADSIVTATADLMRFTRLLAAFGVSIESLPGATDLRFTVRDSTLYRVDGAFPRLTASSFADGVLPDGVKAVRYQIDLDSVSRGLVLPQSWLETGLTR